MDPSAVSLARLSLDPRGQDLLGQVFWLRHRSARIGGQREVDSGHRTLAAPKLIRWSFGHDAAGRQDRNPISELLSFLHVVSGQEHGFAEIAQAPDHVPGLAAGKRIEPRGGLIEKEQIRVTNQSKGDIEPPPLTPR